MTTSRWQSIEVHQRKVCSYRTSIPSKRSKSGAFTHSGSDTNGFPTLPLHEGTSEGEEVVGSNINSAYNTNGVDRPYEGINEYMRSGRDLLRAVAQTGRNQVTLKEDVRMTTVFKTLTSGFSTSG